MLVPVLVQPDGRALDHGTLRIRDTANKTSLLNLSKRCGGGLLLSLPLKSRTLLLVQNDPYVALLAVRSNTAFNAFANGHKGSTYDFSLSMLRVALFLKPAKDSSDKPISPLDA